MGSLPAHGRYPGAYIACGIRLIGRPAKKSGTSPMAPICTTTRFSTGAVCVLASGALGGPGDTGCVSTSRAPQEAGLSMLIWGRPCALAPSRNSVTAILFVWAPRKAYRGGGIGR